MSKEFALDLPESSVKSDAKLPPVEYDVVISLSAHRMVSVKPQSRCYQVPIECSGFLAFT
jgi:hypothetical protein